MAVILSIETSTPTSSIALHQEGCLVAEQSTHQGKSHSEYLVPSIKNLCEMSGLNQKDIEAIAISRGPGSYTGLRIGTSSAKGLCFGLDIPLLSVNTLKAMAHGLTKYYSEQMLFCPMIDARRMEVYCSVMDEKGNTIEPTNAKVIDENSFQNLLKTHKILFFGPGAKKCEPILGHHQNAQFIDEIDPSARNIGPLAWEKYQNQEFEDLAYFEPFYLKDFIAKKPSAKKLV